MTNLQSNIMVQNNLYTFKNTYYMLLPTANSDSTFGVNENNNLNKNFVIKEESNTPVKGEVTDFICIDVTDKVIKVEKIEENNIQDEKNSIYNSEVESRDKNIAVKNDFSDGEDKIVDGLHSNSFVDTNIDDLKTNINAIQNKLEEQQNIINDDKLYFIKPLDILQYEAMKHKLVKIEKEDLKMHCKICNRTIRFNYYFKVHLRQHSGILPFECNICNKRFAVQYALTTHKRIHTASRPYKCDICGKDFKILCALTNHKVIHKTVPSHKCEICNKIFRWKVGLTSHLLTHQENRDRSFICEICGKSFTTMNILHRHKWSHNPADSFTCMLCEKNYKNKRLLAVHMISHSDVKSHVCSYCGRGFKYVKLLKSHVRTHTGEKPFVCKICDKTFGHSGSLHKHMLVHTDKHQHSCEKCSKTFRYSQQLKSHMKTRHS